MQWVKTKTHFGPYIWACLEDQGVSRSIFHTGLWEGHVESLLYDYVHGDITFLDVGANLGYFSMFVANKMRQNGCGSVYAVEANPIVLPYLMSSVVEAGLDDYIHVLPYAVSDRTGLMEMRTDFGDNLGGTTMQPVSDGRHGRHVLPTVRLDDVLADIPRLDIVKMDVEGAEFLAINGMQNLLQKHKPDIVMEINHACLTGVSKVSVEELVLQMRFSGYEPYDFCGRMTKLTTEEVIKIVNDHNYYDFLFQPE